jgi:hypothetical protein
VGIAWVGGDKLHVARRAPGAATFTEATPLQLPPGSQPFIHAAIQGGNVYVVFPTVTSAGAVFTTTIRAARLAAGAGKVEALPGTAAGGALQTATFNATTQAGHQVNEPSVAVAAGTVHVAWEDLDEVPTPGGQSVTTISVAKLPDGGAGFGAPIDIAKEPVAGTFAEEANPSVVASGGQVRVAWMRRRTHAVAAREPAPDAPLQVIPTSAEPSNLHAVLDRSGTLLLAWEQSRLDESVTETFGARLPAGAATATPARLTQPDSDSTVDDLVIGVDGSALAVPNHVSDSADASTLARVQASLAAPGATFGGLEEVSGPQDRVRDGTFDAASGAIDPNGRALVAWTADMSGGLANDSFFLSERDATPPSIRNVSAPSAATTGTPITFAAETSDDLGLSFLTWDFGDGTHAAAPSVNHSYGSPGTYTVKVTARDDAGNVATESRTVAIAAPAAAVDRTAPVVTRLRSSRASFRLSVDERATLVFSFKRKIHRRRVSVPGVLIRIGRGPGEVTIPFKRRVGGTRLKKGAYVASVRAIDAAGNGSRPATASFKVASR